MTSYSPSPATEYCGYGNTAAAQTTAAAQQQQQQQFLPLPLPDELSCPLCISCDLSPAVRFSGCACVVCKKCIVQRTKTDDLSAAASCTVCNTPGTASVDEALTAAVRSARAAARIICTRCGQQLPSSSSSSTGSEDELAKLTKQHNETCAGAMAESLRQRHSMQAATCGVNPVVLDLIVSSIIRNNNLLVAKDMQDPNKMHQQQQPNEPPPTFEQLSAQIGARITAEAQRLEELNKAAEAAGKRTEDYLTQALNHMFEEDETPAATATTVSDISSTHQQQPLATMFIDCDQCLAGGMPNAAAQVLFAALIKRLVEHSLVRSAAEVRIVAFGSPYSFCDEGKFQVLKSLGATARVLIMTASKREEMLQFLDNDAKQPNDHNASNNKVVLLVSADTQITGVTLRLAREGRHVILVQPASQLCTNQANALHPEARAAAAHATATWWFEDVAPSVFLTPHEEPALGLMRRLQQMQVRSSAVAKRAAMPATTAAAMHQMIMPDGLVLRVPQARIRGSSKSSSQQQQQENDDRFYVITKDTTTCLAAFPIGFEIEMKMSSLTNNSNNNSSSSANTTAATTTSLVKLPLSEFAPTLGLESALFSGSTSCPVELCPRQDCGRECRLGHGCFFAHLAAESALKTALQDQQKAALTSSLTASLGAAGTGTMRPTTTTNATTSSPTTPTTATAAAGVSRTTINVEGSRIPTSEVDDNRVWEFLKKNPTRPARICSHYPNCEVGPVCQFVHLRRLAVLLDENYYKSSEQKAAAAAAATTTTTSTHSRVDLDGADPATRALLVRVLERRANLGLDGVLLAAQQQQSSQQPSSADASSSSGAGTIIYVLNPVTGQIEPHFQPAQHQQQQIGRERSDTNTSSSSTNSLQNQQQQPLPPFVNIEGSLVPSSSLERTSVFEYVREHPTATVKWCVHHPHCSHGARCGFAHKKSAAASTASTAINSMMTMGASSTATQGSSMFSGHHPPHHYITGGTPPTVQIFPLPVGSGAGGGGVGSSAQSSTSNSGALPVPILPQPIQQRAPPLPQQQDHVALTVLQQLGIDDDDNDLTIGSGSSKTAGPSPQQQQSQHQHHHQQQQQPAPSPLNAFAGPHVVPQHQPQHQPQHHHQQQHHHHHPQIIQLSSSGGQTIVYPHQHSHHHHIVQAHHHHHHHHQPQPQQAMYTIDAQGRLIPIQQQQHAPQPQPQPQPMFLQLQHDAHGNVTFIQPHQHHQHQHHQPQLVHVLPNPTHPAPPGGGGFITLQQYQQHQHQPAAATTTVQYIQQTHQVAIQQQPQHHQHHQLHQFHHPQPPSGGLPAVAGAQGQVPAEINVEGEIVSIEDLEPNDILVFVRLHPQNPAKWCVHHPHCKTGAACRFAHRKIPGSNVQSLADAVRASGGSVSLNASGNLNASGSTSSSNQQSQQLQQHQQQRSSPQQQQQQQQYHAQPASSSSTPPSSATAQPLAPLEAINIEGRMIPVTDLHRTAVFEFVQQHPGTVAKWCVHQHACKHGAACGFAHHVLGTAGADASRRETPSHVTIEGETVAVDELERNAFVDFITTHPDAAGKWCAHHPACKSGNRCKFAHRRALGVQHQQQQQVLQFQQQPPQQLPQQQQLMHHHVVYQPQQQYQPY